jgi:seryl-tRNA synthetase
MVLDIDLFREEKGHNPQVIRDSQKKRYKRVELVDDVIAHDSRWRTVRFEADQWNKVKNLCGRTVGTKKQAKENEGDSEQLPKEFTISLDKLNAELLTTLTIKQLKHLSLLIDIEIEKTKQKLITIENERNKALHEIGNIVHESVPVSNDEVISDERPYVIVVLIDVEYLG